MAFTKRSVLPRSIPDFSQMKIGDNPLPPELVTGLKRLFNLTYDVRDFVAQLFVDQETPAGQGTTYTLKFNPSPPESLRLYKNGLLLRPGVEYSLNGNAIVLAVSTMGTDWLLAYYRKVSYAPSTANTQASAAMSLPVPPLINPAAGNSRNTTSSGGGGVTILGVNGQSMAIIVPAGFANVY